MESFEDQMHDATFFIFSGGTRRIVTTSKCRVAKIDKRCPTKVQSTIDK